VRSYISTLEEDSPAEFTVGETFSAPDFTNLVGSGQTDSSSDRFQPHSNPQCARRSRSRDRPLSQAFIASRESSRRVGFLHLSRQNPASFRVYELQQLWPFVHDFRSQSLLLKGSQPQSCVIDCRCRITKGIAQCQHPNHRILVPALHHATP
jgi:hypothetical protein